MRGLISIIKWLDAHLWVACLCLLWFGFVWYNGALLIRSTFPVAFTTTQVLVRVPITLYIHAGAFFALRGDLYPYMW
jgi:hypothetical protein